MISSPSASDSVPFDASFTLQKEWDACCEGILGVRHWKRNDGEQDERTDSNIVILNLVNSDNLLADVDVDETDETKGSAEPSPADSWFANACSVDDSLSQMSDMIRKNQRQYVIIPFFPNQQDVMTDEEASILESTVLSFAATTANQIESLREQMPPGIGWDMSQHFVGIVACLLLRLREDIAEPMASLQKQRSRVAFEIFRHPMTCRIVSPEETVVRDKDYWNEALGDDRRAMSDDVRFIPRSPPSVSGDDDMVSAFRSRYESSTASNVQRPVSLFQKQPSKRPSTAPPKSSVKKAKQGFFGRKPNQASDSMPYSEAHAVHHNDDMLLPREDELRQEAALLTIRLQSDLDSVQKVEERMTEITQLLSQFSSLVSEQQEDIQMIHDTAVSSKNNVAKGQDMLVDASERTKRSKHYMAKVILGMALVLLFFNYVTP